MPVSTKKKAGTNKSGHAGKFPAPAYADAVLSHNFADGQKYFLRPLLDIHYAHALMLASRRILSRDEARLILAGLDGLDLARIAAARYDGSVEDLFFYVERELATRIDPEIAGKLHIARSRNDIDVTLYRMTLRREILTTIDDLALLREALIRLARAHLRTVMPAHTHTQPAQPTTLAHYLSAAIEFISRDIGRFRNAWATVNRNPLGACAITTTGFPIDREMTARLLGFEGLQENSYGAIGGIDYLTETIGALATSMISLGKFVQDLLLWGTQEFSFIRLGDGYVQTSSIMPQKRNPVALEHGRIICSKAYSQAIAVMTSVHNTPFGDIVDVEDDLQPLVFNTFIDARRAIALLTGAIGSITVNEAALRRKASGSFLTMTELADTLTRAEKLSFKMAHHLVAQTVKALPQMFGEAAAVEKACDPRAVIDVLLDIAQTTLGHPLKTPRARLEAALCPLNFVEVRTVIGGPAPDTVKKFLDDQTAMARADRAWRAGKTRTLAAAARLVAQARRRHQ
ncbi:MAG: argininosuccinate lyase [Blastocatellia bacterium]